MQPRGSVNPVTVLVFLALAGAAYWAFIFGPLYLDNMSVGEALDIGIHAAGDDERKVNAVLHRVNAVGDEAIGSHVEEDANGDSVVKPGLGLSAENVTITHDDPTTVRIAVDYTREVRLKPTQKTRVISFHKEKEGPISQ